MKVSTQPMSAFSVYSEKLKQKKKKAKSQESNGVGNLKKSEPKSTNKKTWQMKEIGYILKKLAERSAETSSPRAASLLNRITEANKKIEHNDSSYLQEKRGNVIIVGDPKKKTCALKKRKVNNTTDKSVKESFPATVPVKTDETSCIPFTSNLEEQLVVNELKLKNGKASLKKGRHRNIASNMKAQGTKSKMNCVKLSNEQLSKMQNKKSRPTATFKIRIKPDKKGKGKPQKKYETTDKTSKRLFEWLITPIPEDNFMSDFWEKKPLLIKREGNQNYFSELLNTEMIDAMLRENNVCFTKHLDVTSYTDGLRETHNMSGRAQANVVWDFYSNGCSVRLLNPQIFLPKIHALNATLQEYFGCFIGSNVYLTPPNSQGFAPHYDDIEAFVLQIEGKKHWKVYTPRTDAEVLPRFSSPNLSQEELPEPFLDVTLEPGDLLYFPRGFIHQASTVEGEHSLHITLSAYQKTAWVDLMEKVLPIALKRAAENDVEFRRGLPRDYLGLEYRGSPREKQSFSNTAQFLMEKLGHYVQLSLGAGVDRMGAQFMHDALPPVLAPGEKLNSSVGGGLKLKNGKLEDRIEFQMETCVKLTRYNVCRLVENEEDEVRLYHCLDNSLEYHGEDPQFLVLPPEGVQVITHLQASFPAFVPLKALPHEDPEALIALISDLWDAGLLLGKDLPIVEEG